MEEKVFEILKEVLELSDVDRNLTQKECDTWDSMAQLNIAAELESAFDVSLEPEDIAKLTSVQNIIDILKTKNQ